MNANRKTICDKRLAISERGITLVELMITIFISAIVIMAVGAIYVGTQRSWIAGGKRLNLQRDASYAMKRMAGVLRGASWDDDIDVYGDSIYFGGTKTFFVSDGDDLVYSPYEVMAEGISGTQLNFSQDGSSIEIGLTLKQGDDLETTFSTTVLVRN